MPYLPPGSDLQFSLGKVAHTPDLQSVESPGALDLAAAALRSSNVAGAAYESIANFGSQPVPVEGYDGLLNIPKGYELQADAFKYARSPAESNQIREQIDQERRDALTISRAGGWGVATTFASGLTDPLTIASMALPLAGETRLANAARFASVNAATAAAQEGVMHGLNPTRSDTDSILNIGASAVLGGLLGPIFPRIPSSARKAAMAGVESEGGIGPATRSVIDDRLKPGPAPDPEASYIAQELRAAIAKREQTLRATLTGPEAERAASLNPAEVQGNLDNWKAERDSLAKELEQDKAAQIAAETTRLTDGPGVLEALRRRYNTQDVSSYVRERAEKLVNTQRAETQKLLDDATERVREHQRDADLLAKQQSAQIDLEQHMYGLKEAEGKGLSELAQVLPEGQRGPFERRIEKLPIPTEFTPIDALTPAEGGLPDVKPAESVSINPNTESTTGAAAVRRDREGLNVAKGARALVSGPGRVTPFGRIFSSRSYYARDLLENLANIGTVLEKHMEGRASPDPVERRLWAQEGVFARGRDARLAAFKSYAERVKQEGGRPMKRGDFMEQITYAMRRGDQSEIPEIAQAAKDTRSIVFQPLYDRARKLGLLPEEATLYAESYVMRSYDAAKINANLADWHDLLQKHFQRQGVDPAEAITLAHEATRTVMGAERGTMHWRIMDSVPESGRMKARTLTLPDKELEPFLVNNIDDLTHGYLRSMAPDVELTERFGSRDLKDQIDDILSEYDILKGQRMAAGDNAGAVELDKERNSVIRDIEAIRDRLRGTFGQTNSSNAAYLGLERALRAGRNINVVTKLGSALISHTSDLANLITRYGLPQTFAALAKMGTSLDLTKLAFADAKRLGAGLDMAMSTMRLMNEFGAHSQNIEDRTLGRIAGGFTMVTGETPFISAIQATSAMMGQHEILSAAEKIAAGETVNKNLLIRFAQAGLDKPMLERIAKEAAEHATEYRDIKFGHSDLWADREAAMAIDSAILKDAHSMTLRPSVADTPLFMSTMWGKSIMQFKTFAFAAQQTVINPLAQGVARGDPRAAVGLMSLLGAGYLSYRLHAAVSGSPLEENPVRVALEVIDKSNLMGWTGQAIFPSLWQFGFKDLARWSDRDQVGTYLGPTAEMTVSTLLRQFPAKLTGGDGTPGQQFTRSDLHYLRRTYLPGQNVWFFRNQINGLEDRIGDAFDLPGTSNAERALQRGN